MAVTNLQLREPRDCKTADRVQLGSNKIAVLGVDAVSSAGSYRGPPARDAADAIETVMRIREPKPVAFESEAHSRVRFELKNSADIMDILQRDEIHVAIKFVIRREEIIERLVFAVARVFVTRTMRVFHAKAWLGPGPCESVACLRDDHIGLVIQSSCGSPGT